MTGPCQTESTTLPRWGARVRIPCLFVFAVRILVTRRGCRTGVFRGASVRCRVARTRIADVGKYPEQGVDVNVALKRQVERSVDSHAVDVPPPLPFAVDVPGFDQIGNGAL